MGISSHYEAVLPYDGEESTAEEREQSHFLSQGQKDHPRVSWLRNSMITVCLLLVYSLVVVSVTMRAANKDRRVGQRFLKTPVDNEYIIYEPRVMGQWEDMGRSAVAYFTDPSETVDKNWHELFRHQNIGIRPELMRAMDREKEGIRLPDGSYYGSIMVFHHLHCLKNLYHALNPEYYGIYNMTSKEKASWKDHTTHCLHMLKEAVMCQGDTTILTMMWADYRLRPIGNLTAPHECVNWNRLMEWVKPNSRDLTVDGYLVHPKFGPVVVDGHLGDGPIT